MSLLLRLIRFRNLHRFEQLPVELLFFVTDLISGFQMQYVPGVAPLRSSDSDDENDAVSVSVSSLKSFRRGCRTGFESDL
ncbi:hypothetical protein HanRHA438_Chr08g0367301 [Helianthus annuus]|nr:hypothetical protein HanRHA438_Chr08g0367301 [Helianthus annuus]